MSKRIALVTGATQGLGLALVAGLARRLDADDVVYLTGRSQTRMDAAAASVTGARAEVRTEMFDVADPDAASQLAVMLHERHGGVDVVVGNAVMRITPDQPAAEIIDEYVEVNNLGTTRLLRAFAPPLRPGGRLVVVASALGTLYWLAPALHNRFDDLTTLDAVDAATLAWRDAVTDGGAFYGGWPAFVNIPSKIAQVAAIRALAAQRRDADVADGTLVAAFCPGMINTPTSGAFWDVSDAPTADQAAIPLLALLLGEIDVPASYGQLIRGTKVLPWKP